MPGYALGMSRPAAAYSPVILAMNLRLGFVLVIAGCASTTPQRAPAFTPMPLAPAYAPAPEPPCVIEEGHTTWTHAHDGTVIDIAWSHDGTHIACLREGPADQSSVIIHDADHGADPVELQPPNAWAVQSGRLAWSADDATLSAAIADTAFRVWRVADGQMLAQVSLESGATMLTAVDAVTPVGGDWLLLGAQYGARTMEGRALWLRGAQLTPRALSLGDIDAMPRIDRCAAGPCAVLTPSWIEDAQTIASPKRTYVFDLRTGARRRLRVPDAEAPAALSSSGDAVLSLDGLARVVRRRNVRTGALDWEAPAGDSTSLDSSADGTLWSLTDANAGWVRVIRDADGSLVREIAFEGPAVWPVPAAISPDNTVLATIDGGVLRLTRLDTGESATVRVGEPDDRSILEWRGDSGAVALGIGTRVTMVVLDRDLALEMAH